LIIESAPDSPPIVLGMASRLKRSAAHAPLAGKMRKMNGILALKSPVDKQSVTIRFDRGHVKLSSGVAGDADLVITLDFNDHPDFGGIVQCQSDHRAGDSGSGGELF